MNTDAPLFGAVRRVVTGHDEQHRSVFTRDEMVEPISAALFGRTGIHWLYGADEMPTLPVQEPIPAHTAFYPPPGGLRFGFLNLPPRGEPQPTGLDVKAAMAELDSKLPGMASQLDPHHPGMHRTATVDAAVVLNGLVTLELDDGATVELIAGDTVIQNGTRHRWTNRGPLPASIAYFLWGVPDAQSSQGIVHNSVD